jgi:hypothetical protein
MNNNKQALDNNKQALACVLADEVHNPNHKPSLYGFHSPFFRF